MKIIIPIIIIAVCSVALFFLYHKTDAKFITIKLKDKTIRAEVADTVAKRAQGLSGHMPLKSDEGMFFIFETSALHGFWMHEMTFPIDIIWINENTIVGFKENAPVPTSSLDLPMYYPPSPVNHVLEANAGSVASWGLKIGDTIQISQ